MDARPAALNDSDVESVARVVRRVLDLADDTGFVPFDRFMEVALYSEGIGYYARDSSPVGPAGDFYTAAHVHPLFGRAISERILGIRRALGPSRRFEIVEAGAGDGALASSILESLGQDPRNLDGLSYHLVEVNPALAVRARERVEAASRAEASVVVESAVGADGPFEGVVIANELLDAQPVRRLRWTGSEWHELGVRVVGSELAPGESASVDRSPSPEPSIPPAPGIVEISPAAEGWIRSVGDHLVRGAAVVIDYGLEESELFRSHPSGTLASVRHHRSTEEYWRDPGTQDLSAFVNFTRVRTAARRAGFVEIAYGPQAAALGAWGFPRLLEAAVRSAGSSEEEVRVRLAAKNLLFGFEQFRVLELAAPLSGNELGSLRWPAA
jgi:SAM-dependent MidA family methyltransferase